MSVPATKGARPEAAALAQAPARGFEGADLLLTAPVFFVYHLGIVFLSVRNGLDPVTDLLLGLLGRSLVAYLGVTGLLAVTMYAAVRFFGLGGELRASRVGLRLAEATGYAVVMAMAARSVTAQLLGPRGAPGNPAAVVVVSFGAGFYEELAFRVVLFGLGVFVIGRTMKLSGVKRANRFFAELAWAVVCAATFSGVHYLGPLGDHFALTSFVFRLVCGLVLTAIYRFRGFAAAVWTHAIYDVGVMI